MLPTGPGAEKAVRWTLSAVPQNIPKFGSRAEAIGKHIPCIIGKVEHEEDEQIIYVEEQNFEENTITDINGRKYFIDWLSMDPRQYQNLVAELNNKFPKKLKKYFMSFCGKGLKFDMIALNDSLPILGVAGAFKIKWFWKNLSWKRQVFCVYMKIYKQKWKKWIY